MLTFNDFIGNTVEIYLAFNVVTTSYGTYVFEPKFNRLNL